MTYIRHILALILLAVVSASGYAQLVGMELHPDEMKVWCSPDRKTLFVEGSASRVASVLTYRPRLEVSFQPSWANDTQPISKNFRLKLPEGTSTKFHYELPLSGELLEWSPVNPLFYEVRCILMAEADNGKLFECESWSTYVGFQSPIDADLSRRVVTDDEQYAGYDRQLPPLEVDARIRYARSKGYDVIRDLSHANSTRFIYNTARLGMLYEPRMNDFHATYAGQISQYLDSLDEWVKCRAASPAVWHWILPAMPDSIFRMCQKRIAALDARPVLSYDDASLLPADAPLPELTLQTPSPVQSDTLLPLAPQSLLRGAPGVEYVCRINCGGATVTDSNGQVWAADTVRWGIAAATTEPIAVSVAGTQMQLPEADQAVMQSYRICTAPAKDSVCYILPVDRECHYCLELYFQEPLGLRHGERIFYIGIGEQETTAIDLRTLNPSRFTASKLVFSVPAADKDYIRIHFPKPLVGHPILSAIALGTVQY